MRLLQLLRALRYKDVGRFHIRLDRVHHRSLFVNQISEFLVDFIHSDDVLFEFPDAALLLLECLHVDLLLHLRLSLLLIRGPRAGEVVLEGTVEVARTAATSAAAALATRGTGNRLDRLVGTGLFQGILLVVHSLPLHGLERSYGGGELVHQSVPLHLQVAVLAVPNLVDHVLRVTDQLLRVCPDLMAESWGANSITIVRKNECSGGQTENGLVQGASAAFIYKYTHNRSLIAT